MPSQTASIEIQLRESFSDLKMTMTVDKNVLIVDKKIEIIGIQITFFIPKMDLESTKR